MPLKLKTLQVNPEIQNHMDQGVTNALSKLQDLKNKTCVGAESTGWWDWPKEKGFEDLKKIKAHIKTLGVHYDLVLVIGIGGSYAGTRAIAETLRHQFADQLHTPTKFLPIVYAGHNLCEQSLMEVLDLIEQHEPIINVISKSGSTIEPNVAFRIFEDLMNQRYGQESQKRILVTTQEDKNPLHELALKRGYAVFPIPENVGGRYSVLTAAGLLPLQLAHYDTEQLLSGADRLFSELRDADNLREDHPLIPYVCLRHAAFSMGKSIEVLSYQNPKFSAFVEWWKQLFAESEGKDGKGLMPLGMAYTTDLHSLGQFLQEGPASMMETFLKLGPEAKAIERKIRVPHDETGENQSLGFLFHRYVSEIDEAAWTASQTAHSQRGLPCVELSLAHRDAYHLGYLLAFFQVACAVSGLMLEVNPFNQPGVEVYKKELYRILGKEGHSL